MAYYVPPKQKCPSLTESEYKQFVALRREAAKAVYRVACKNCKETREVFNKVCAELESFEQEHKIERV